MLYRSIKGIMFILLHTDPRNYQLVRNVVRVPPPSDAPSSDAPLSHAGQFFNALFNALLNLFSTCS